ncbi:MAG: carbamoyltransferase [candidate division Zixibacteria bacterium]|nr:carbamoyltransferase [candidate division Zixibacteria bacterium]
MNILGISCFYHDAAAALVVDGALRAAAQEERFTGTKHDPEFPINAIRFCLEKENLDISHIDGIVFYDKPFTKFDRILQSYFQTVPKSYPAFRKAIPVWLRRKLWLPSIIKKELQYKGPIYFVEHHLSHAAGTYYTSPFERAAILTIDGVGEWATASIGKGVGNRIELSWAMNYPHSVGLLYSAFTYFLGFQVNSAEYKVMGLAPYGRPLYAELIRKELVQIFDDGSIHLNMKYFKYHYGLEMTGRRFDKLFGRTRRNPESELTDSDRDLAASIQEVTGEIILKMANHAKKITGENNLCLSGGVALNCTAAGHLLQKRIFDNIHIQPAASDCGGAVGAALYMYYSLTGADKINNQPYFTLGPSYNNEDIEKYLTGIGAPYSIRPETELIDYIAGWLSQGKIVALLYGPMEFGPRALGFRSILASPQDAAMKARINSAVKYREPFRPFAPVVLEEKVSAYFENGKSSPYMLFNFDVKPDQREKIPAVTHIDGTARIQTVNCEQNPRLYGILKEFERRTGVAVLLNTSFNLRGRPIVRTPQEAFATFISSGIDALVMENCALAKETLPAGKFENLRIATKED